MSMPLPPGLEMRTTISRNSPVDGLGMRTRTITCSNPSPRWQAPVYSLDRAIHSRPRFSVGHTFSKYPVPMEALMSRPRD